MSSIPVGYPSLTIKDANGNVIYEGICSSYSLSIDRNGRKIKAEGLDLQPVVSVPKGIEFVPLNLGIDDLKVSEAECEHKWKKYQGFTDSYDYCDTCGVKK